MPLSVNLNIQRNYHVNKRYRKHVNGPMDYLVGILGLDCEEKKLKKKICDETLLRYSNKKFAGFLRLFFSRKRKTEVRRKLKTMHYEEVEEAV